MIRNRIYQIVIGIVTGCFIIQFFLILFSNPYLENKYLNRAIVCGLLVAFTLLLFAGYRLLTKHRQFFTKKRTILILAVLINLFIVVQLLFVSQTYVIPSWDFGAVYERVSAVVLNGESLSATPANWYFAKFGNNSALFFMLYGILTGLQKIGCTINESNILGYCIVINCVFIHIAFWLAVMVFVRMKRNTDAIFLATLLIGGMILLFYSPIFYTDTLSMFVPLLLFHIILSYERRPLFRFALAFTVVALIGYFLKLISIFVLLAYVCYLVLKMRKKTMRKNAKKYLFFFLSLLAFVVLIYPVHGKMQKELGITEDLLNRYQYPYTHWVMMGMQESEDCVGGYFEDAYIYTEQFWTKQEKIDKNIERIGEVLKERGFWGEIAFLGRKGVYTWGDGSFYSLQKLIRYQQNPDGLFRFLWNREEGHERAGISYYMTGLWYSNLLFIILSFCMMLANKKVKRLDILRITIMGLYLFLMFWETRSRYLVAYIPVLYIIAVDGMKTVNTFIERRKYL